MTAKYFYDCDGRTGGPADENQLRRLVQAGIIQPQHRIRRDGTAQWIQAGTVRMLFPGAVPTAMPLAPPLAGPVDAGPPGGDNPFDFGAVAAHAPPPAPPRPAKSARPAAPPPRPAAPPVMDLVADDNPFAFAAEPPPRHGPPPHPPRGEEPGAEMAIPPLTDDEEALSFGNGSPFGFAEADKGAAEVVNPFTFKPPVDPTPSPPPPKPVAPPPRTVASEPSKPVEPATVEIGGPAVEVLPDGSAQLLDGQTLVKLHRSWLSAKTTHPDGFNRWVNLRIGTLDAAILDRRPEPARRGASGKAVVVLSFHAGTQTVAIACPEGEKAPRAFLEKVMQMVTVSEAVKKPK